jgi:uncharacterized delta-60 repeat protein
MNQPKENSPSVKKNTLIQYNPNGTLDTQFGTNGTLPLTPVNSRFRILKNGKIIVASDTTNNGNVLDSNFYSLARYNSNGSVDSTFGKGGAIKQQLPYAFSFTLLDVIEQNDEKIVVGGSIQLIRGSVSTLFRYLKNGMIDTTFGTKGRQITSGGPYWYYESYQGMSLQGDGKILFCSTYYPYARYMRFNNSFVVGIANPTEKNRPLSIFPNPAKNELNIDLKDRVNSDFAIKICDLTGRIVYQNKYDKSLINNIVQINIGDLVLGLYVLTIQTEKEILSQLVSKN